MASAQQHALPTDPVERALARAAAVLPDQGPIGVFVHHNTLHAFQHLPFDQGVQAGAGALGAQPYLSQRAYRSALASGRIALGDVAAVIAQHLAGEAGAPVLPGLRRAVWWQHWMTSDCDTEDAAGLEFAVAAGAARVCADLALWQACLARCCRGPASLPPDRRAVRRHRDVLIAHGSGDPDVVVHGELIRLASGFLDMGQARAPLPGREGGFLQAVAQLHRHGASVPRACRGAAADLRRVADQGLTAHTVISEALAALGVASEDIEPLLVTTALALPGWAGMFSRLERHPEDAAGGPPATLAEFVAVRLLLERRAVEQLCRTHRLPTAWPALRQQLPPLAPRPPALDAAVLWTAAHAAASSPAAVLELPDAALQALWRECAACSDLVRRQLWQQAYERTYRRGILDALAARYALGTAPQPARPRAQFVFCIDEREESIRRALEEQHPGYLTLAVAGFFGVAIDYQGLYDREPVAHCPVVVTPAHEVYEQPVYTDLPRHLLSQRWRQRWLRVERGAMAASRTLTGGAALSFLLGPLSALKTLARVSAPRASLRWAEKVSAGLSSPPTTRLSAMRSGPEATVDRARKLVGFSLDESVDRVCAVLTNLGLVRDFAPIVVFLGHGSTSLNNPHESAHDCGACGGRRGGANARLFADMANRVDVREGVRRRGIDIPADTWFVGALHDTADDSVKYYDLEQLPVSLAPPFEEAYRALEQARRASAQERCRRFEDAPLSIGPEAALRHVEGRAGHLAQPRPEYGHCTNAICVVGRREWTRGLHLDRRAFLVSYDPTVDADDKVLERILAAVGPVGAGISLEYYFSSVDNETFGCGTKLPHNVTGLLGVMNGHQSDLRTGLPLQMVELHEPMRLLLVVEAPPEALLTVAGRQAEVAELVVNGWIQLVSLHPQTGAIAVFEGGRFAPYQPTPTLLPVVERSAEWHMRTRDHLVPALVRSALPATAVGPGHAGGGNTTAAVPT